MNRRDVVKQYIPGIAFLVMVAGSAAPGGAMAQSAQSYRNHVQWCESIGGTHNNNPSNPVCTPPKGGQANAGGAGSGLTPEQQLMLQGISALIQGMLAPDPQAEAKKAAEAAAAEAARIEAANRAEEARQRELEDKKNRLLAEMQGVDDSSELSLMMGTDSADLQMMNRDETRSAPDLFGAAKSHPTVRPGRPGAKETDKAAADARFDDASRSPSGLTFQKTPDQQLVDRQIAQDPRMIAAMNAFITLSAEREQLHLEVKRLERERAAAADDEHARRLQVELDKARKSHSDKSGELVRSSERVHKLHRTIGTQIADKKGLPTQ